MKRFILSVALCSSVLVVLALVFARTSRAKEDLIQVLLDLPAPPPPNPFTPPQALRSERFYDKNNPPKDDAPIADLLDYWTYQAKTNLGFDRIATPSERTMDRLLAEIKSDPQKAYSLYRVMADSTRAAEVLKDVYDAGTNDGPYERSELKSWLRYNSPYFTADLDKGSGKIADTEQYLTNQDELLALGKYDWQRAQNHVNRLYADSTQPTSQVLAKWVLYRHALAEDSSDIDRYRDELRAVVENRSATPGQRDLALDALLKEKEWPGRDDWYFSLFEDETLGDLQVNGSSYTGLTTLIHNSPDGKYAAKMIELAASKNPAVRAAAVRNLGLMLTEDRPEIIRVLLPWLENPKWAIEYDNTRQRLVRILQKVAMPESVPGLLAALDEKDVSDSPAMSLMSNANVASMRSSNPTRLASNIAGVTNTNSAMTSTVDSPRMVPTTFYPLRDEAIGALGRQGDMRAGPPLRRVFTQVESYRKLGVVEAMLNCNAFTAAEQLEAVEEKAGSFRRAYEAYQNESMASANTTASDGVGEERPLPRYTVRATNTMSTMEGGGYILSSEDTIESQLGLAMFAQARVSDDLVRLVLKRIRALEKTDPQLAEILRSVASRWESQLVNSFLLDDLRTGKAGAAEVVRLLTIRRELREKQQPEVVDVRAGGAAATGFSVCLLESEPEYAEIFAGPNADAKKALLACGRLIRAKFPVTVVAGLLQSEDKQLALAAERYLESEDSPEARRIVLALHPNEAKILGATVAFGGGARSLSALPLVAELFVSVDPRYAADSRRQFAGYNAAELEKTEKRLQKQVMTDPDLLGVYSYDSNTVRIYKDRAVFAWDENESRYRERTLGPDEFDAIKSFFARNNVDGLAPFLGCEDYCEPRELVMLSRYGGRRVFFKTSFQSEFTAGLDAMIAELRRPPAKLHYWLEAAIPGFEVVFADERYTANSVWKSGSDLRLLVFDSKMGEEINRKRNEAYASAQSDEADDESEIVEAPEELTDSYAAFSWRSFAGGTLGGIAPQPDEVPFFALKDSIDPPADVRGWKARSDNVEIRASDEGLFKIAGGVAKKIGTGRYARPVISANGRWALVEKFGADEEHRLVRVDLFTGREYGVASQFSKSGSAVVYVRSIDRFLFSLYGYYGEDGSAAADSMGTYGWMNPATGAVQPASGDLRPIVQQQFRPLQPSSAALEYWAAIPDTKKNETVFGIYSTRTFAMRPLLTLPKIRFNSQEMWVDEPAGKVYFVSDGHVLAAPFGRQNPPQRN